MAGIKFDFTSDNKNLLTSVRQAQTGVTNAMSAIERSGRGIESTFSKIKGSVLGGFADIAKGMAGLTALLQAGNFFKTLVDDAAKFNVAMKEVSTLSQDVADNFQRYKDQVVDMTTQIPIGATEAAKALYQIESAGHHGADGLNVLRESAKGAIGGVTDTATTADAITTVLNAYKLEASEAQHISDLLFTTVRLGKTNMSELGRSMSQVAPVAAAYGVSIEDVLAAVASLTKQGTPTSIAIRQVRDAITAVTASLGDGAFQGRNFLDAMDDVARKSQGSNNALKEDLHRLQAMNAVLGLTGKNAASARQDMSEMQNSAGAAEAAYEKMASTAGTQTTLLRNNIFKAILPLADEMKSMSGSIARYLNEAFDSGAMDKALVSLEAFIAAYATYRGLLAATTAWNSAALGGTYQLQIAQLQQLIPLKELDGHADLQAAVAKGELTIEEAKFVASLQAETAARYEEIMAAEAEARANLKALTVAEVSAQANMVAAEELVAAAQARVAAAIESGSASEIEAAKEELNTANRLKNTAATELNTIQRQKNGAATMASVTAKNADTAATLMNTTQQGANATSTGLLATAKLKLKMAIDAVNSSFLASPLFWIGATIAAVAYAVYSLVTAESANEAAIRKANDAMDEQNKKLGERRDAIDRLIRTIQDPNATDYQKAKAYDELKQVASDITDAYSKEALASMEAADAQKLLNKSMDEAAFEDASKKVEEWEKKVEDMTQRYEKYQRMSKDGVDVSMAPDFVSKGQLEEANAQLEIYRGNLEDIVRWREEASKAADEEAKPIEIRVQEAESNEIEKQRVFDFFDQVMLRVEDIQTSQNNLNFDEAQNKLDAYIREIQSELADLHQQVEQNPLDQKLQMQESEKTDLLNKLLIWKNEMNAGGFTTIPLIFQADWGSAQVALKAAKDHYANLFNQTTAGGAQSVADLLSNARNDYNAALKEWQRVSNPKNQKNVTPEEYNKAKSNLAQTKSTYESYGGDPDGKKARAAKSKLKTTTPKKTGKTSSWNQSHADADAKEMMEDWKEEMKDLMADVQQDITDASIEILDESTEKTLQKLQEDENKEVEAILKQRRDLIEKRKELDKKLWEKSAEKHDKYDYKEKSDAEYAAMIEAEAPGLLGALGKRTKQIIDSYKKQREELAKELAKQEREAMVSYLKEYGDMEQQRLAITQEYEAKIAEARKRGASDYEIASLTMERDKQLKKLDSKAIEQKIDWNGVFSSLEGHTKEYLVGLRNQLQSILSAGNLPVDQMAVVQDKLREINAAISEKGDIFTFVGERARENARLQQEAADAQEKLAKARTDEDTARANLTIAKKTGSKSDIVVAERKLSEAREKTAKATAKAKAAEDAAARTSAQKIADTFADAAEWVNKYLSDLPDLLGKLGLESAGEKAQMGLDAVNDAAGAAADYASGNYVGAAMKAFSALDNIGNIVGVGGLSDKSLEGDIERLTQSNENLQKAIDALADELSDASVLDIKDIYDQQREMLEQTEKNYKEMMSRSGAAYDSGTWGLGIGGSHSSNKNINDALSASDWAAVSSAAKTTVRGAADFWNLSSKQMYLVMRDANAQWTEIMDKANDGTADAAKFMNEYIELWKKQEEVENQYKERWTSVSFDSVKSSFLSALSDMDKSASDFSQDFTKYLFDAVMNAQVGELLEKELKGWYADFAKYMESGAGELTDSEIQDLREQWDKIVQQGVSMRDAISEATGYTGSSSEGSATYNAAKSFTQEQGDILNGRLTAIQINTAEGNAIGRQIAASLQSMASVVSSTTEANTAVLEIRNMMIFTNSYLEDLVRYAKATYNDFGEKIDKVIYQIDTKL